MRKALFILVSIIVISQLYSSPINARDFEIKSEFNIYLDNMKDEKVRVVESLEIKANNSNYYIPAGSRQTITIPSLSNNQSEINTQLKKDTLKVTDRSRRNLEYTLEQEGQILIVRINNLSSISRNNPFFAQIEYETKELINHNGNIINIYLPGLHENTIFEDSDTARGINTKYNFEMAYNLPKDSPNPSFISPETIYSETTQEYIRYVFPQEDRVNNTGWIQLGEEQYYYFQIIQEIPQTDFLTPKKLNSLSSWVSRNILELTLPKEFRETNQQVFFTKITPEIHKIRRDEESHIIAIFEPQANEEQTIEIEGYIKVSGTEQEIPNISVKEYIEKAKTLNRYSIYTQPDQYWESDNWAIQDIAKVISEEHKDGEIIDVIRASYQFVIDSLEYSIEKATTNNIRIGAFRALQGEPAVCMEYADLLIAILRAQDVPARAAIGYGNDPNLPSATSNIAANAGHQWVQVWIPDYGWLSVDPTWGETRREYIGSDLDHVLWYTVGASAERISDTRMYSADLIDDSIFDNYRITVIPIHESNVPNLDQLTPLEEITIKYENLDGEESEFEKIMKTTIFGRTMIFVLPVIIILILTTTISTIISRTIKARRKKKASVHHINPEHT